MKVGFVDVLTVSLSPATVLKVDSPQSQASD